MTDTLRDLQTSYYSALTGQSGRVEELERIAFNATSNQTWNDAARSYYGVQNGSSPVGTLLDEAFKFYSGISGLSPAANYSLADHMDYVFRTLGGPGPAMPPVSYAEAGDLEAYYDASNVWTTNATQKNLLSVNQSSVETDLTYIGGGTNTNIARVTTQSSHGSACLSITSIAAGNFTAIMGNGTTGGPRIPVVAGQTYTVVADLKAAVTIRNCVVGIEWFTSSGSYISGVETSPAVASSTSAWTQVTKSGTAPANAAYADVYMQVQGAVAGSEVHYVDRVGFWKGTSTTWVAPVESDGKPADGFPVDRWADLSVYRRTKNLLTYNQATVETDTTGWVQGTGTPTIARSTTQAAHGIASLSLTTTAAGTASVTTGATGTPWTNSVPVTPGQTITGVASVFTATAGRSAWITLYFQDAGGAQLGTSLAGNALALGTSTWTQVSMTGTVPANAVVARLVVAVQTPAAAGEVYYIDKAGVWKDSSTDWVPPNHNARDLLQATPANQPIYRKTNLNLLTYNQCSVETDTTGFNAFANCSMAVSSVQAAHGVSSLALTVTANGNFAAGITGGTGGVPVTVGTTYTATVSVRAATASRTMMAGIEWFNAAGSTLSYSYGIGAASSTSTWTNYFVTAVAPANAAFARVFADGTSGVAAEVHYIDKLGFWAGSSTVWTPPVILFNSRPAIQFVRGSAPIGAALKANTYYTIPQPVSAYIVAYRQSSTAGPVVDLTFSDLTRTQLLIDGSHKGQLNAGTAITSTAASAANTPAVFSYIANGASSAVAVNGVKTTGNAGTNAGSTDGGLTVNGFGTSGAQRGDNPICAILIFSGVAHSDTTRQKIERWLGARYGIAVA